MRLVSATFVALAGLVGPLGFVHEAAAACPATERDVRAEGERARAAFRAMDADALQRSAEALDAATACLGEVPSGETAALVHEAFGLDAFVRGDTDAAAFAFAAARAADPAWKPDPRGLPPGHPVYALVERYDPATLARRSLRPPARGELVFDGRPTLRRPLEAPALAQWVIDGDVASSRYLWADTPMVPYDVAASGSGAGAEPARTASRRGRSVPWWIGAGAGLALSGGSLALAVETRGRWASSDDPVEVERLYGQNHAWTAASVGLGVVGVGCGVGALVTTSW